MSGLVMLLPHGFEGQGPEHSSARIERFLQICADDNLQVVNCTTPAQYFHALRRQMRRSYRCPLVIFTPKSLLRRRTATSLPEELAAGGFQRVIADAPALGVADAVQRVVLCSGKLYYELVDEREKRLGPGDASVALVRAEQLYPWPEQELAELLHAFAGADRVVWAQEEPANMGAWTFVRERIQGILHPNQKLAYAGRPESASPAAGSMRVHRAQQAALLDAAFQGLG
jgi:2-oxoglutarate dehydrogenase E1 component